ncbi:MAG: hypothetical protein IT372_31025 [Polyangiaceae bacterium]|nr:hypothetical protein [Polyangiaceae bacterium]
MKSIARRASSGALFFILGCGTAATVCGCYDEGCSQDATCKPPVCDEPSAGPTTDACGIHVSSSLGDDANPGTRAAPVRTMKRAISLARTGPPRVYACAEVFAEAVTVPSGVGIWGGLDCANEWIYLGGDDRTVLAPEPNLIPLQVEAGATGGISTLADLRLEAADATVPSGSSIAMLVLNSGVVEIRRSELIAGNGADGEPGVRGGEEPAKSGAPGSSGNPACSADLVPGAQPVTTVCDDGQTIGAKGGDGAIVSGSSGNDGQPEPDQNVDGWGLGGAGEAGATQCLPGAPGLKGADGMDGLGAVNAGRIAEGGWFGVRGKDGGNGLPGQGGGGGGGSRGGSLFCGPGATPKGGASGGSGGGGGCGGRGGQGGGYGGASIGLLTLSGDVNVFSTSIRTGKGGDGGHGGLAQFGGSQGPPGLGGSSAGGSQPGCPGGWGGTGGNGGYGGGGLGGPSLGVAHLVGLPAALHDSTITTGMPGKGGPGGNQSIPGSNGEDGIRGDTLALPQ